MSEGFWFWAWGAAGALVFAGPTLGLKVWAKPHAGAEEHRRRVRLAIWSFLLALITAR